jgi:universal stress protein F
MEGMRLSDEWSACPGRIMVYAGRDSPISNRTEVGSARQGDPSMYKTILVPVDLAEVDASKPAIDKAVALADAAGGTVRLIYVRSVLPVTFMEFVPPDFDAEQQADCEARLGEIAAKVALPKECVSSVVRLGSVYSEILDDAESIKADLVVVASHRPAMSTYLLGSNASTIVRHAMCSVLVVREG